MNRYSPSRFSQTSDIQQSLEKTLKLLNESEKEKNDLKAELLSLKRELTSTQKQQNSYILDSFDTADQILESNHYSLPTQSNSSYLESLIKSEIGSFYLFAQNCYHKCSGNESIGEFTREKFKIICNKFQDINQSYDSINLILPSFVNEIQNFSRLCFDSMMENLSYEDYSQKIHDTEMQRIKTQSQLFSLQQKINEENEKNQTLLDQIENEHQQISNLTSQFSILSPIKDDSRFVERQVKLIQSEISQRDFKIRDNSEKVNQFSSMLINFIYGDNHPNYISNEPSYFKHILDEYKTNSTLNDSIIRSLTNILSLSTTETNQITREVTKLIRDNSILQQLQSENLNLKSKMQSLESYANEMSDKNRQTSENFSTISQQVQKLKVKIAELESRNDQLESENSQLSINITTLTQQTQLLDQQKNQTDSNFANISFELATANDKIKQQKEKIDNLTSKNSFLSKQFENVNSQTTQLQLKSSKLAEENQKLIEKVDELSNNNKNLSIDNKVKKENIEQLTKTLQIANSQVRELKEKQKILSEENDNLKTSQINFDKIIKQNKIYLNSIEQLTTEIDNLKLVKQELDNKNEQFKQTQSSFDGLLNAYQNEKEKRIQMKSQMSDLLKIKEQFEQVQNENLELLEKNSRFNEISRKYKDLIVIEKQEKAELAKLRTVMSENIAFSDKCLNLTTELEEMKKSHSQLEIEYEKVNKELENLKQGFNILNSQKELLEQKNNRSFTENKVLSEDLDRSKNLLNNSNLKLNEVSVLKSALEEEKMKLKNKIDSLEKFTNDLQIENKELQKKVYQLNELTKSKADLEITLNSKDSQIQNLSDKLNSSEKSKDEISASFQNKNNELKALKIELHSKVSELQAIQSSLKSQIQTKELIIATQNSQIEELKGTVQNMTEQNSLFKSQNEAVNSQIANQNLALKDQENKIKEQKSKINSLSNEISQLADKNEKLDQLNKSLSAQLDSKSQTIEDNENEITELKKINYDLSSSLDRSSLKISELQSDQLTQSQLERDLDILQQKLQESERQNHRLAKTISKMKANTESIMGKNDSLTQKINELTAEQKQIQFDIMQKEKTVSKLKKYIQDQNASIEESERQKADLSQSLARYDNDAIRELLKKIENGLSSFPIERDISKKDSSIISKLKIINGMINKVRTLYDDLEINLERLSSLTSTQHETIVKMSKGRTNNAP